MTALLILSTLGVMLLGFLAINKLDAAIAKGAFGSEPHKPEQKNILLFSEPPILAGLCESFSKEGDCFDCMSEPCPPPGKVYRIVCALSANDLDNLLLCRSAQRATKDVCTIARCNNRLYEGVFRQAHITHVLIGDVHISSLLSLLEE